MRISDMFGALCIAVVFTIAAATCHATLLTVTLEGEGPHVEHVELGCEIDLTSVLVMVQVIYPEQGGCAMTLDGQSLVTLGGATAFDNPSFFCFTGLGHATATWMPIDAASFDTLTIAVELTPDVSVRINVHGGRSPDLDGDGVVDVEDLMMLLGYWGTACADLTGDGTTGVADLMLLLQEWG